MSGPQDRPIAIDFFCCEGAVSRGLHRAGFDVVGVDLFKHANAKGKRVGYSQDRYPFHSWQGDAIEALDRLLAGEALDFVKAGRVDWRRTVRLSDVTLKWGSPPCQHASAGTRALRAQGKSEHPALIEPTRERFQQMGGLWVIENVSGAALHDPTLLCGSMFGLRTDDADGEPLYLERHRLFEASFPIEAPGPCDHTLGWAAGVYGGSRRAKVPKGTPHAVSAPLDRHEARYVRHGGYVPRSMDVQRQLLGLDDDLMTGGGMRECVPPSYAEHVARAALAAHALMAASNVETAIGEVA